jgi:DNA-binding MarR family transcriptional regulator
MIRGRRDQGRAQAAELAATCACFGIRKAARAVTQVYDEALRPTGLRTTQFTLLMLLQGHGPMGVQALAREAVTDRTTLTRNLGVLEERGLVRIAAGEDARVRLVELTAAGADAAAAAFPLWRTAQAYVSKRMGPRRLTRLLADLATAVDTFTEAAG